MKSLAAALALFATPAAALDRYLWENRPVLIFADGPDDPRLAEQTRRFDAVRGAVDERDIVLLDYPGPHELRARFGLAQDAFAVILIGKDGGEKFRAAEPVQPGEIFTLIDGMPMRRREMRAD